MPEVAVIEVPDDPLRFIEAIEDSGAFDAVSYSAEDRNRAGMVAQDRERIALSKRHSSVEAFLEDLRMEGTVGTVDGDTLDRVAQLVAKTNQYNLTTRRHSAGDIRDMVDEGAIALWMRLRDKFGDQGLIGVAIAVPDSGDGTWLIDTFLLSCRVLMRRAESVLLSVLVEKIRERDGRQILGEYIPTARNSPAADLYADHGFESVPGHEGRFVLDLEAGEIEAPPYFKLRKEVP